LTSRACRSYRLAHHAICPHNAGNDGNITTVFDELFAAYRAPTRRLSAAVGAWSLADDYPPGIYAFQLVSPFGWFWRRATSPPAVHGPKLGRALST
jgi:hypothetical protein